MATTPVFLPGKSHGQRSLVGYSPWGPKESDMTERLHTHICIRTCTTELLCCTEEINNTVNQLYFNKNSKTKLYQITMRVI